MLFVTVEVHLSPRYASFFSLENMVMRSCALVVSSVTRLDSCVMATERSRARRAETPTPIFSRARLPHRLPPSRVARCDSVPRAPAHCACAACGRHTLPEVGGVRSSLCGRRRGNASPVIFQRRKARLSVLAE